MGRWGAMARVFEKNVDERLKPYRRTKNGVDALGYERRRGKRVWFVRCILQMRLGLGECVVIAERRQEERTAGQAGA